MALAEECDEIPTEEEQKEMVKILETRRTVDEEIQIEEELVKIVRANLDIHEQGVLMEKTMRESERAFAAGKPLKSRSGLSMSGNAPESDEDKARRRLTEMVRRSINMKLPAGDLDRHASESGVTIV